MSVVKTAPEVNWEVYAGQYDMLADYNPYYRRLHARVMERIGAWEIMDNAILADLGAGTGNYSIAMARLFPQARVLHIDNNPGMNAAAAKKARDLSNFQIIDLGIEAVQFSSGSLQGLLCINAIYTFPEPQKVLKKIYNWMAPGGRVILVDPGRVMNVFWWKLAIGRHLISTYGFKETLKIIGQGKDVEKQNAYIRKMQLSGVYWTHTHEAFCQAVRDTGFCIEDSSLCFRGYCDLVVAQKI